jgi:hypothetical protein
MTSQQIIDDAKTVMSKFIPMPISLIVPQCPNDSYYNPTEDEIKDFNKFLDEIEQSDN